MAWGGRIALDKLGITPKKYFASEIKKHAIKCERLQTLPDNYTEGLTDRQRYEVIGNGWTIDVISHIFSFIPQE